MYDIPRIQFVIEILKWNLPLFFRNWKASFNYWFLFHISFDAWFMLVRIVTTDLLRLLCLNVKSDTLCFDLNLVFLHFNVFFVFLFWWITECTIKRKLVVFRFARYIFYILCDKRDAVRSTEKTILDNDYSVILSIVPCI